MKRRTKNDIILMLINEFSFTRNQASGLVDSLLFHIYDLPINQDINVDLSNFGLFEKKHKNERIGRNPRDLSSSVFIPERDVLVFKAHKPPEVVVVETETVVITGETIIEENSLLENHELENHENIENNHDHENNSNINQNTQEIDNLVELKDVK